YGKTRGTPVLSLHSLRSGLWCGTEPFEHELLNPISRMNFGGVKVPFRIDSHVVRPALNEVSRSAAAISELVQEPEGLPVQHDDVCVAEIGDVQETLLGIRGERHAACGISRTIAVDENLRHVLAIDRE